MAQTRNVGKYALDLDDMTLGQGHNTPLGHGQQLYGILSKSSMKVESYGLDKANEDDRWMDG